MTIAQSTIGIRFPPQMLDRINAVAAAAASRNPLNTELPTQSDTVRGLVARGLPILESELGIAPPAARPTPLPAPPGDPAPAPDRQPALPFAVAPPPAPPGPETPKAPAPPASAGAKHPPKRKKGQR
jgi:hypothetical protein